MMTVVYAGMLNGWASVVYLGNGVALAYTSETELAQSGVTCHVFETRTDKKDCSELDEQVPILGRV